MESCPTQAVLPLVGLAAEKVIRDRYNWDCPENTGPKQRMQLTGDRGQRFG
ncbi:MAG: hypothetical protein R6U98_33065 [Pirellulaceae bacterium]